ncbi:hypothetical protein [uncultured Microbacterium sp.]|uniref:hypothetical protein n=1 Tax=uncultured Microbacterium sp. TaxID=191216 RepID=UPI0025EAABDB|nr:hypothetical protein [uncultured Microbacterium sp.]
MNRDELRNDVRDEYPDENWDTECAGFAYLVCRLSGTVRRAYASATDARNASQIVSTDPAAAPAGAFHHWSYPARLNGVYKDWGHVAAALGGGRAVMTNPEWNEWDWGICLGETDVAAWTARRRGIVTYLGWSYTYGENTANITNESTAGGNARPFEEDDMTPEQSAKFDKLLDLAEYLEPVIKNGEPGVDLSRPRFDNAISAILDLRQRFIYRDGNGTPTYDLAQLTANEIKPMLLTLIAAVGRPSSNPAAPIDVAALAAAIREGLGEDLVAALAKQLTK